MSKLQISFSIEAKRGGMNGRIARYGQKWSIYDEVNDSTQALIASQMQGECLQFRGNQPRDLAIWTIMLARIAVAGDET